MERIFLNDNGSGSSWIIGKIAEDIMREAHKLGFECNRGSYKEYNGEEIVYHLFHGIAAPFSKAKHNSLFYTHLNLSIRERELIQMKDEFDSFVCMSPEDAEFLIELGFDEKKVFGKVLPVRNTYIKPISIGIFSACYTSGVKNEKWLVDFIINHRNAKLANYVFIGSNWGEVVQTLQENKCAFEWHYVPRTLPYEYEFQQNKLNNLDYYIYMGMDGGAMGTYDAYARDVRLCVTYDGFHKEIPTIEYPFDNQEGFNNQLNQILSKHEARLNFFQSNTPADYTKWIINVWLGKQVHTVKDKDKECLSFNNVVEKKRSQYYKLTWKKIKSIIRGKIKRYKLKSKMNS